ncbi:MULTISPECIES: hypothetical protein [Comamonas]|uniref:hypothetical protein n=1 Tax=Comamonas TaxID=283 RepID=UPI0015FAC546|nr:hypothetical protein [Comamonas koreensis]
MNGTELRDGYVVLDDGTYFVALNTNYELQKAPGFLYKRCARTEDTPQGWECVGGFDTAWKPVNDGKNWRADVDAIYDEETDSDVTIVANNTTRMEAIALLWQHRHTAFSRH